MAVQAILTAGTSARGPSDLVIEARIARMQPTRNLDGPGVALSHSQSCPQELPVCLSLRGDVSRWKQ
ncbi:hypothetical protein GCM10010434_057510 [Winogradskya humida]